RSDPFARPGDRWLGDICAKRMTAWIAAPHQLENCRGAATNIEYALARELSSIKKKGAPWGLTSAPGRAAVSSGCRDGSISNFDLCRILAPAAAQTQSDAFCRCGSRDAADAGDMRPRDRHRPRLILRIGLQSSLGVCEAARVVQHDGRGFAMMLKN